MSYTIVGHQNSDIRYIICRRHVNLLCLNIPGMVMSLGQPSNRKKAAQLVQVSIHLFTVTSICCWSHYECP